MGRGGAERVVSILSSDFASRGNKVSIATEWEDKDEYPLDKRVKRIHAGLRASDEKKGRAAKIVLRYLRLYGCIKKEKPDIVISFCNKANFRCSLVMCIMKTPLLVSVRNDPKTDYAPYKAATKIMEKKAAGCVFQTPDAKAFFSEKFQKKSKIILNPIAQDYFDFHSQNKAGAKEIVTVGRMSKQKNQMLLLRAFADICGDFPDYKLKLYGSAENGRLYQKLKDFAIEKGIADRVTFMGTADKLHEKIADASLFVLPSDYEGMPNALMEAMALGLPVIATDCPCGGAAMLVENKKSGMLVRPGDAEGMADAMRYMLSHPDEAGKMGDAAREAALKAEPKKICGEWFEYIREITGYTHER